MTWIAGCHIVTHNRMWNRKEKETNTSCTIYVQCHRFIFLHALIHNPCHYLFSTGTLSWFLEIARIPIPITIWYQSIFGQNILLQKGNTYMESLITCPPYLSARRGPRHLYWGHMACFVHVALRHRKCVHTCVCYHLPIISQHK